MTLIPEPYQSILQGICFVVFLYYLIRNWGKIEETDRSVAERNLGFFSVVFIMVACCVILIVFHDNPEGRELSLSISKWILLALLLAGGLYIEFKYGRNKEIQQKTDSKDHL